MAAPVLAPMPEGLVVDSGYTIRATAIDPVTGALVAGVNVGLEVITGESAAGTSFPIVDNPILLGIGT